MFNFDRVHVTMNTTDRNPSQNITSTWVELLSKGEPGILLNSRRYITQSPLNALNFVMTSISLLTCFPLTSLLFSLGTLFTASLPVRFFDKLEVWLLPHSISLPKMSVTLQFLLIHNFHISTHYGGCTQFWGPKYYKINLNSWVLVIQRYRGYWVLTKTVLHVVWTT